MRIVGRHRRGQRQARIDSALELDQHRHAAERAVGVRYGVEKTRRAGGARQRPQAADCAGGVEDRRLDCAAARVQDRQADRVQHTIASKRLRRIERERVAENDPTARERTGQRGVGRRFAGLRRPGGDVAIRLGEDDVQRDHRGAQLADAGDELRDQIATPRPLADRRQAALVHIHDRDSALGWRRRRGAHQRVVDAVVHLGEKRRAIDGKQDRQRRRGEAAQENDSTAGCPSDLRGVLHAHLIVISTRRLRGSTVPSGVGISRSASPCEATSTSEGSRPAEMSSERTAVARFRPSS